MAGPRDDSLDRDIDDDDDYEKNYESNQQNYALLPARPLLQTQHQINGVKIFLISQNLSTTSCTIAGRFKNLLIQSYFCGFFHTDFHVIL